MSALKQVELCHLKSIEDHIALAYRVYCWVAKNISYTSHVNETNPSAILKTKQAVCSRYASLFLKLAKEVGLSVIRVDGNTSRNYVLSSRIQFSHLEYGMYICLLSRC